MFLNYNDNVIFVDGDQPRMFRSKVVTSMTLNDLEGMETFISELKTANREHPEDGDLQGLRQSVSEFYLDALELSLHFSRKSTFSVQMAEENK
jgi:hypothetical protein